MMHSSTHTMYFSSNLVKRGVLFTMDTAQPSKGNFGIGITATVLELAALGIAE